jgi:hypothetical protein
MHSLPHGHSLEQLGSLYGSRTPSDQRGHFIYATLADQTDDYGGPDRLRRKIRQGLEGISIADHPIIDIVLADPQDDAVVEIAARGRFRVSADNT